MVQLTGFLWMSCFDKLEDMLKDSASEFKLWKWRPIYCSYNVLVNHSELDSARENIRIGNFELSDDLIGAIIDLLNHIVSI
jgi:hypothetical protein